MIATVAELLARRPAPRISGERGDDAAFGSALHAAMVAAAGAPRRGDGPPRVAILLPQGPTLAGALLGVMAVATAIPLNPRLTRHELAFVLDDTGSELLLLDSAHAPAAIAASVATDRQIGVVDLRTFPGRDDAASTSSKLPSAEDHALLLHTSGTTARPKLVPLSHANLLASAAAVADTLELSMDDRGLAVMPLFHIHGIVGSLLASLWVGSALHVVPFDALRFQSVLAAERISWVSAVPTMYQAMLLRPAVELPATLRLARSSSSPMPTGVWRRLQDRLRCPVVNSYGMSEAAHQMASTTLHDGPDLIGSVGTAAGPEVSVLTAGGVQQHGHGEIVVRGPNLMSAYLSPLGANQGAFVDGWFRTGDTGTIDQRGVIRLLGRLKEIINVGGEKVSPFEIDDALLTHPAVTEAVAYAAPSELLGEVVHAVVTVSADVDEATLRTHARERLVKWKVPVRIHIVEQIPKGPTGKVQRIHLAAQFPDR